MESAGTGFSDLVGGQREACLAIDVGGTKLAAGLVDPAGLLLARRQVPTPTTPDAEVLFDELARLVVDVLGGTGCGGTEVPVATAVACGIGCGGPMSAGGELVSPLNIPAWRAFPLRGRIARLTGLPTALDNDAKAFALGEGWVGAARTSDDFLAMVVSTGVGGGIVLDGRLLSGASGNAGHIGHVMVEPDGRLCPCGARGCLEAEASGLAIAARTGRPPVEAPAEERARAGRMVGRAVASAVNLLDIPLIVVAGSVALGFGEVFFQAANAELASRARLAFAVGSQIVPAGLGGDGPLIGAGAVGWRAVGVAATRFGKPK